MHFTSYVLLRVQEVRHDVIQKYIIILVTLNILIYGELQQSITLMNMLSS